MTSAAGHQWITLGWHALAKRGQRTTSCVYILIYILNNINRAISTSRPSRVDPAMISSSSNVTLSQHPKSTRPRLRLDEYPAATPVSSQPNTWIHSQYKQGIVLLVIFDLNNHLYHWLAIRVLNLGRRDRLLWDNALGERIKTFFQNVLIISTESRHTGQTVGQKKSVRV